MEKSEAARDTARAAAVPEVERARAAFAAGDAILLLTYNVSATGGSLDPNKPFPPLNHADPSQLIAMIEDVGWVLERMDHVWIPGASGRFSVMTKHAGLVQGYYLFRRVDQPLESTDPQA